MPVFLCRWQNGDFSVVKDVNKDQAVEFLDAVANAEDCLVVRMRDFMAHFRLSDDGEFILESFGDMAYQDIMERGYPVLDEALSHEDETPKEEGLNTVRGAVDKERKRLWPEETDQSKTEPETLVGGRIKGATDAPSKMIDRIVKKVAKEKLNNFKGKGKPNRHRMRPPES